MQLQKLDSSEDSADEARRSIHDIAAAIISVRALAEMLAEHVPTLVAMSHSRHPTRTAQIPPETLDALPSVPAEIVVLCEIAREALQNRYQSRRSSTVMPARSLPHPITGIR